MGTIFRALNKSTHAEPSYSEPEKRDVGEEQRYAEESYQATTPPPPRYTEQPRYTEPVYGEPGGAYQSEPVHQQYVEERAVVEQPVDDTPTERDLNIGQRVDDTIQGNSKWQRDIKKVAVNISVAARTDDETAPVVMFTGIEPNVGTSTVASNVAKFLVDLEEPKKVLLIDVASKGQAKYDENLLTLLADGVSAADIAVAHVQEGVTRLSLGATSENLQSVKLPYGFREFVQEASRVFDWVVLDAPPFMSTPITDTVGRIADGSVVVARYSNTRVAAINACVESMEQLGIKPLGLVVNHRKYPIPSRLMKWL